MTHAELLHELEALLEVPTGTLQPKQSLKSIRGWDSMASVLLIAFADEKLGLVLSADQIARANKVEDLLALLGGAVNA